MSHEMIRHEAEAEGYDTDGATIAVAGDDRDHDVVNVWPQLPDADTIEPGPPDEYGDVGSEPPPEDDNDIFADLELVDPITEEQASDR